MALSAFEQACVRAVDRAPLLAREKAAFRLAVISCAEAWEAIGHTRSVAMIEAANEFGISTRTVWNWRRKISGCGQSPVCRLRYLLPVRSGRS